MMRKKRGYQRETPAELVKDYKLFAIACEGSKREPEYFKKLRHISNKIAVDVIEDIVSNEEALTINPNKSAPKWVLDRAMRYVEKEGLHEDDDLWFVMDIDRWTEEQLREVANYCNQFRNWHLVLSNPCFEVWLYFHKKSDISISKSVTCSDFKNEISTFEKGGYNPINFLTDLSQAIINARAADSDQNHFIPKVNETKLYKLFEAVLATIGKNDFDAFIEKIVPTLTIKKLTKKRFVK